MFEFQELIKNKQCGYDVRKAEYVSQVFFFLFRLLVEIHQEIMPLSQCFPNTEILWPTITECHSLYQQVMSIYAQCLVKF